MGNIDGGNSLQTGVNILFEEPANARGSPTILLPNAISRKFALKLVKS